MASYYEKELQALFPLTTISVQFTSDKAKTRQLDLTEDCAQAILDMLKKLGLIKPEEDAYQKTLEAQYNFFDGNKVTSERALRAILAYKYWEDGSEWEFVEEVWYKDPIWTQERCLFQLRKTFNYGGQE